MHANPNAGVGYTRTSSLGLSLHNARSLFETWITRHRTRTTLRGLTDRELDDLGISRAEAMAEAHRPFWK